MSSSRHREERDRLTRQITFRLTEDEYSQLEGLAHADERRLTDTARRIFRRGLPLEEEALRARGVVPPSAKDESPQSDDG